MLLSEKVLVFRNADLELLEEPFTVSVITVPAPNRRGAALFASSKLIEETMIRRIKILLLIAADNGYKNLVLGAWGCGAFGNNAKVVSDLFYPALSKRREGMFREIVFAVRSGNTNTYNFTEFYRNFGKDNWDRD